MHDSDTDKLQRRNRELSILNAIAEALNREVDLSQALTAVLAQVALLLDLQTGWIWLLDEDTGKPTLAAAQSLPPGLKNHPHRMKGSCFCLDTYESGDMEDASNVSVMTCSRLKWLADGTEGLRYHATIPLHAHGKELGVMNVASADWRELSADELQMLYTVGDLLGIAVERARLFSRSTEIGAARERNRLAREIHDTLAQGLAAIALQLETADALLEGAANQERVQKTIQQALHLTRANLEEARRSVMDLRASQLEGRSLVEALTALGKDFTAQHNLPVEVSNTGSDAGLSARVEASLYRIAQEALTNTARHANAAHIRIELNIQSDQVHLLIKDDGAGFELDTIPEGRYGLIGLNERAHLLNGTLNLCSTMGEGTIIEIVVPLEDK